MLRLRFSFSHKIARRDETKLSILLIFSLFFHPAFGDVFFDFAAGKIQNSVAKGQRVVNDFEQRYFMGSAKASFVDRGNL